VTNEVRYQTSILLHSNAGSYLCGSNHRALTIDLGITCDGDSRAVVQPMTMAIPENSMLGRICSGCRLVRGLGGCLLGYAVSV
jgi:hypothetical protein